jgi:hypothetical protein
MVSIIGVRVASRWLRAALSPRTLSSPVMSSPSMSFLALLAASVMLGCSEGSSDPLAAVGGGTAGAAGSSGGQTSSSGSGGSATAGTSAGGTAGGGSGGSGPMTEPLVRFDFPAAADIADWQFAYADPMALIPQVAADAGDVSPQEGVASAEHDSMGDPSGNAGSIRLVLPFSGPSQKISFETSVATNDMGVDLRGRSISARISVLSGYSTDPMNPPGLKLYVKTGAAFFYADSGYQNIAPGSDWQTFTWGNVSNPQYPMPPYPAEFDPTDVRQVGIEFDTGSAGAYSSATVLLDTVAVY